MHPSCPSCSRHAINLSSRYWLCRQVNFNTHRGGGKDCEQRLSCDITYAAWFAQDADRWIKSTSDRETAPTTVVPTVSEKRSFWVLIYTQTQYSSNNQFIFTARRYASAVFAVIVCLSVRHKPVLYRSVWTNRAGIWYGGFLLPIPHCVIRKFGYIQKLGYFPLEVCPDASRQVDRVVNNSSSSSSSSIVELVDDTYATVDESWLFTKVGQL